uniref:Glycosyl hydrolase family 38 C-terminal domain-containing protein n=1 Tax=Panagrolaimus sp. JU765 TaxID=591449 RepID=A0AC34Q8K1_9BILA
MSFSEISEGKLQARFLIVRLPDRSTGDSNDSRTRSLGTKPITMSKVIVKGRVAVVVDIYIYLLLWFAYDLHVFRPQNDTPTMINYAPHLTIAYLEARQIFSQHVSQIIRLIPKKKFIEFEWTIGPIPKTVKNGRFYGQEIFTRYQTKIKTNGIFYTDSNGRQLLQRKRNFNIDYNYQETDSIPSNMYPVNTVGILKDDDDSLAIMIDRSQSGGSIVDGTFDLLLHRRDFYDDRKGVDEPLNELGNDGRG